MHVLLAVLGIGLLAAAKDSTPTDRKPGEPDWTDFLKVHAELDI